MGSLGKDFPVLMKEALRLCPGKRERDRVGVVLQDGVTGKTLRRFVRRAYESIVLGYCRVLAERGLDGAQVACEVESARHALVHDVADVDPQRGVLEKHRLAVRTKRVQLGQQRLAKEVAFDGLELFRVASDFHPIDLVSIADLDEQCAAQRPEIEMLVWMHALTRKTVRVPFGKPTHSELTTG